MAPISICKLTKRKLTSLSFFHPAGVHKRDQLLLRLQFKARNTRVSASYETLEVPLAAKKYEKERPLVKMCGITSARDAAIAAEAGADFIGMIIWPKSKRSVSLTTAKEISKVARNYGAEPVGVFVDDDADSILKAAAASNIEYVQLHGNGSRSTFPMMVKEHRVIYVLHSDKDGLLLNNISEQDCSLVDWILVDSATGGRFNRPSIDHLHVLLNIFILDFILTHLSQQVQLC
ncbi:N-(5'-phosphoribosyl)anthranilate isomerase 1 chloroplastic [Bienertia sinuspersici]